MDIPAKGIADGHVNIKMTWQAEAANTPGVRAQAELCTWRLAEQSPRLPGLRATRAMRCRP